jgi:asparagine synthase (glutamine-hydrolysing)
VPQLADMYDEPFADSSQIPTHLISKLTREHVTVALTGDGGDELFAGYNRYNLGQGVAGRLSRSPRALRQAAGALLDAMPGSLVEAGVALLPAKVRPPQPVDKLKKFAAVLPLDTEEAYRVLVSQNRDPGSLMFGKSEHEVPMPVLPAGADDRSVEQMQLCDQSTFLPDDILQKVDRASMAVSLEVRPPLLDHRVVSFAWRLPRAMRIRDGETKWLLRRVLDRYVPRELVSRPKMGFAIPLAAWLRGPLRPWAEDLLDPSRLAGGLLDPAPVRRLWDEHVSGRHNRAYALWTILMYEAWRRRWSAA